MGEVQSSVDEEELSDLVGPLFSAEASKNVSSLQELCVNGACTGWRAQIPRLDGGAVEEARAQQRERVIRETRYVDVVVADVHTHSSVAFSIFL